jgi:broad specificity phosphatase PhoE
MARLVFVRHGRTFGPDEPPRRVGRRTDLPLTTSGAEDVQRLKDRLKWLPVRRIWASRLLRSRQTATILASGITLPRSIRLLALLDEIDHGPDENRVDADVIARIGPAAIAAWDSQLAAPDGWILDLHLRRRGWVRLARVLSHVPATETIIAVGSQGAIRLAVSILLPGQQAPRLRPAHFGILHFGPNNPATMIDWDLGPHGTNPP